MWSKIQLLKPSILYRQIDYHTATEGYKVFEYFCAMNSQPPTPPKKYKKTILFWFIFLIISPLQSKHTPGVMYYICSGCMLISAVFSLLLPETKGRALENMIAKKTGSKIDNEGKNNDQSKKHEVYDLEKY